MHPTDTNQESSPAAMPRFHSTNVLTAVADAEGQSPTDLEPLYDAIDPEALDTLFAPRTDGRTRARGSVSFQYLGYWVTVSSDGAVELEADTT